MLKNFNKNYRNNWNISIFTSISYHSVFTRPPFLFFQYNHQCDILLPIVSCTHKLKAGIAYYHIFKPPCNVLFIILSPNPSKNCINTKSYVIDIFTGEDMENIERACILLPLILKMRYSPTCACAQSFFISFYVLAKLD